MQKRETTQDTIDFSWPEDFEFTRKKKKFKTAKPTTIQPTSVTISTTVTPISTATGWRHFNWDVEHTKTTTIRTTTQKPLHVAYTHSSKLLLYLI